MADELMTTAELAAWLKVTHAAIWKWRKDGMPYIGSGKTMRYRREEVLDWLNNRKITNHKQ